MVEHFAYFFGFYEEDVLIAKFVGCEEAAKMANVRFCTRS